MTDTEAAGIEPTLRSYGISVEEVDVDDPLSLTYMTAFPGREIHRQEIGRALNALIDRAEADVWEPVRVEATVVRSPGDPLGTWTAKGEWFDRLLEYELSETEFSTRVLSTVTHVEERTGTETSASESGAPSESGTPTEPGGSDA